MTMTTSKRAVAGSNGWYLLQHNSGVVKRDKGVVFDGKIKHTSMLMHAENSFSSMVSEAYLSADPDVTGKIFGLD